MGVVPNKRPEKVAWYKARIAQWTTEATNIGTSSAACTAMAALITAAEDALNAKITAEGAAEAATNTFYTACDAMAVAGQAIIKNVRSKAESTGNPEVYSLAMVPPPATPAPKGNPGTATNFKVKLNGDGSIELTWKCSNPAGTSGTLYQIFRRISAEGEFEYMGGVGEKKYHDTTIPAGTTTATYKIQAVRSTAVGDWAEFNVNFGTGAGGAMTASVEPSPKLAA